MKGRKKALFTNRHQRRMRRLTAAAAALLLLCCGIGGLNFLLSAAVRDTARAEAVTLATALINTSVSELLADEGVSYADLVTLRRGDDGAILSADTNTAALNAVRSRLTQTLTEKFTSANALSVSIPLGSVVGGELFSGRGPRISVRIKHAGALTVDTSSVFSGAGINQTFHRISLDISLSLTLLLPAGSEIAEVRTNVVLAETIIVGEVPSAYIAAAP